MMMITGGAEAGNTAAGIGDPEGHSEASRRGWDEREGSRGRYRDDDRRPSMPARDDEGRFMSSRSRYDNDADYRRGGGHGAPIEAIRKPHVAAGKSAAARAAVIATTMKIAAMHARATTKAGSPARTRVSMTTMTTGVAAAGMAAGMAIPRATPKRRAAVEGSFRAT